MSCGASVLAGNNIVFMQLNKASRLLRASGTSKCLFLLVIPFLGRYGLKEVGFFRSCPEGFLWIANKEMPRGYEPRCIPSPFGEALLGTGPL